MSYLLIGNISALICDDCIEPLSKGRLRIYLPEGRSPSDTSGKGNFNHLKLLAPGEAERKADRLLAEAMLDERGDFSLSWEQIHLFTEPLELDLCLEQMPGRAPGYRGVTQYHLSRLVPHWKRTRDKYLGAFAYVIPSEHWSQIRGSYGTWVISGTVRFQHHAAGQPQLKVEAYNAQNNKLLGTAYTNLLGRYKLQFGVKDMSAGVLMPVRQGQYQRGPDVYFKVYRNNLLLWEEDAQTAQSPERKAIAPCTLLNITVKPSAMKKATTHLAQWLGGWSVMVKQRKRYQDEFLLLAPF
ncbi:hypothetical protein [Chitinophaga japonensis]|uniref:Uncharacterized protein n=1 Tax=Chitinophaga japonensis TaxID=104662 RepID=A0A562SM30_CHIJA|nr:hypothetical protein [Chitinophaga japonensis]TWI82399.1 hypothetical protein LX66_4971 [Chitinophaga japonensis]